MQRYQKAYGYRLSETPPSPTPFSKLETGSIKGSDGSSIVRLSSFCLESTLLEEADWDDFLSVPAVDGLSACWTVAFAAVVVLLRRHQSASQALVAKDVAYLYCQSDSLPFFLGSTYHR